MAKPESNNLFDVMKGKGGNPPKPGTPPQPTAGIAPVAAAPFAAAPRQRYALWIFWVLCAVVYSAVMVSMGMWIERSRGKAPAEPAADEAPAPDKPAVRWTLRVVGYGASSADRKHAQAVADHLRKSQGFGNDEVFVHDAKLENGKKETWVCIGQFWKADLEGKERKTFEDLKRRVSKMTYPAKGERKPESFDKANFAPIPPGKGI